jgi:NAD(P)-dependent dehydrogenase (short-subunit alcohol dehydrogenase family)
VLPGIVARRWGRIINISSDQRRMPLFPGAASYVAAKAGMLGFTRALAREVATHGITVNATTPGSTLSERARSLIEGVPESVSAGMKGAIPIGRFAEPEDQAGIVLFLGSDEAKYITGATVDVNGGRVML